MTHYSMYTYPWDLQEEGVAAVCARLRDTGIGGLTLSTSYHSGKFLRPHAPRRKSYFPEGGTVYFKPDRARYGTLQPQQAAMARDFDVLDALSRECGDLSVTAWTVGLHNSRLGAAHPDLAAQTPFGDPLINSLCPAQPEVRRYLIALCLDTAAQPGVREIAIETPGWQTFRHGHHHEFELIDLPDPAQILLGTCFCTACRAGAQAGGIDADALARRACDELEHFFQTGDPPATDPRQDPDWAAFQAWRVETVTSLMAEIRAELPSGIGLAVIPTTQTPNRLCWVEGSDLPSLSGVADRLEIPAYQTGVADIAADARWVRDTVGPDAPLGFIMRPTWPHLTGMRDVVDAVTALKALGPVALSFYNYGHMRLESLDWIAAAITSD